MARVPHVRHVAKVGKVGTAGRPYSQLKGPGPGHWHDRQAVKPLAGALQRVLARQQGSGGEGCPDVNSSAITAVNYNNSLGRLTVTFTGGRTYAYFDVSEQQYRNFCNADSKGRYFNQNMRDKYAYVRL